MEKRGLAGTIDQMVKDASAHPGKAYRKPLARGLRVDVMVQGEETYVQISRDNVWPSSREWTAVMNAWPAPAPSLSPIRIFDQGRYYLKARWKTMIDGFRNERMEE